MIFVAYPQPDHFEAHAPGYAPVFDAELHGAAEIGVQASGRIDAVEPVDASLSGAAAVSVTATGSASAALPVSSVMGEAPGPVRVSGEIAAMLPVAGFSVVSRTRPLAEGRVFATSAETFAYGSSVLRVSASGSVSVDLPSGIVRGLSHTPADALGRAHALTPDSTLNGHASAPVAAAGVLTASETVSTYPIPAGTTTTTSFGGRTYTSAFHPSVRSYTSAFHPSVRTYP